MHRESLLSVFGGTLAPSTFESYVLYQKPSIPQRQQILTSTEPHSGVQISSHSCKLEVQP